MNEPKSADPAPVSPITCRCCQPGRTVAAVRCFLLAAVLTAPTAVAFWGQRTLTQTQRYVETVGPLVKAPEVHGTIATVAIQAFEQQVDIEALLNEAFAGVVADRPRLQRLVGPLASPGSG